MVEQNPTPVATPEIAPTSAGTSIPSQATQVGATPSNPNFSSMTSADIAEMIAKLNQPGGEPSPVTEGKPQVNEALQKEGSKPVIPPKFLNPDGSPNVEALAKSYAEIEKAYGRSMNASKENEELKNQVAYMNQIVADVKASYDDLKNQISQPGSQPGTQQPTPERVYTPEELELLEKNPGEFVRREARKEVDALKRELLQKDDKSKEEARVARLVDYEMFTALNRARQSLPSFQALEPKIAELINQPFINQHPDAIPFAYYSLLGQQMPQIAESIRNDYYKQGYEAAKADLAKQVEGGGRDTAPATAGLENIDIKKATSDQLAKVLPRY
jgi:hypothetical protein